MTFKVVVQMATVRRKRSTRQDKECACGRPHLSARQAEVLRLLATGLSSGEIARKLGISARTVYEHVNVARERVGAADRVELIARCYAAEVLLMGWPPRWSGRRCMQAADQTRCPAGDPLVFGPRGEKGFADAGGMSENSADVRFRYAPGLLERPADPRRSGRIFARPAATGVLIGYARADRRSHHGQNLAPQIGALTTAGCSVIFADKKGERFEFLRLLEAVRSGDTVVVRSLDCMADSMRPLVSLVADLARRGIGLRTLQEGIDTTKLETQIVTRAFWPLVEFIHETTSERARRRQGGGTLSRSAEPW